MISTNSPVAPRVSVIVPCRNEATHIAACVGELLALQSPPGGFEVVVADGQSNDGTNQVLRRLLEVSPQLKIIDNPRQTAPCGLNAAIRAARGDIIVRADAHSKYAPDYLLSCLEVLRQTGADNVGGPARTQADQNWQKAIAAAYHSPFAVGGARFHDVNYEGYVDTVTYGCWPKSTFERFGLFDEELVRNQDDEHNLRIVRGGGRVYQSTRIKSWYHPRKSLGALFNQYMQYGYWKVRVVQKHKLPASWRHLVPGSFLLTLFALFLSSTLSFFLATLTAGVAPMINAMCLLLSCLLALIIATYAAAVLVASLITAARSEWTLLPLLPLVFPCYHFGYGYGFLRGCCDFVLFRRGPRETFQALTR